MNLSLAAQNFCERNGIDPLTVTPTQNGIILRKEDYECLAERVSQLFTVGIKIIPDPEAPTVGPYEIWLRPL